MTSPRTRNGWPTGWPGDRGEMATASSERFAVALADAGLIDGVELPHVEKISIVAEIGYPLRLHVQYVAGWTPEGLDAVLQSTTRLLGEDDVLLDAQEPND